jgi:hypothetical protein
VSIDELQPRLTDCIMRVAVQDGMPRLLEADGYDLDALNVLAHAIHFQRVAVLAAMPYDEYLRTDHWRWMRRRALVAADERCQLCNAPNALEVHHRTYDRRGRENDADLTVLCGECHAVFHEHRKLHA